VTMVQRVCSLKTGGQQVIGSKEWTTIRFPYDTEPYDPTGMHTRDLPALIAPVQSSDPESGLIWPEHDAWAHMQGFMVWKAQSGIPVGSRFTYARCRFSRDPFGINDTTATDGVSAAPSDISTSHPASWDFWVHPGVPIGFQVWHNAPEPRVLSIGEFKMSYWVDLAE
jgi:hypothetical protein